MKQAKIIPNEIEGATHRRSTRLQGVVKRKLENLVESEEETEPKKSKTRNQTSKNESSSAVPSQKSSISFSSLRDNKERSGTTEKIAGKTDVGRTHKKVLSKETKTETKKNRLASNKCQKTQSSFKKEADDKPKLKLFENKISKKSNNKSGSNQVVDDVICIDIKDCVNETKISSKSNEEKDAELSSIPLEWTNPTPSIWSENLSSNFNFPNHVHCLSKTIIDTNHINKFPLKFIQQTLSTKIQLPKSDEWKSILPINIQKTNNKPPIEIIQAPKSDRNDDVWTELYKPSNISEVIGNSKNIELLASWLLEWKNKRAIYDNESSNSSYAWSDIDEEMVPCLLITGDTGVGKTSLVYALAQEYKYKVLEVNASSTRGSKQIMGQLQEATQSHHVEGSVSTALTRFLTTIKESTEEKPKICVTDQNVVKKKRSKRVKTEKNANKSILTYFKKATDVIEEPEPSKEISKSAKNSIKDYFKKSVPLTSPIKKSTAVQNSQKEFNTEDKCIVKISETKPISDADKKLLQHDVDQNKNVENIFSNEESKQGLKFSSSTIILFDDVDLVFDEDEGFWSSVNSFIKSTKKPVILTASHNFDFVMGCINSSFQTLNLDVTLNHCVKFLKKINQERSLNLSKEDSKLISKHCQKDFRKILLQTQFWTQNLTRSCKLENLNFNSPVSKFCLTKQLRIGLFEFLLNNDSQEAYLCLQQFRDDCYFILHSNFETWLPLPKLTPTKTNISIENTVKNDKKLISKNLLDISWVSDSDDNKEKIVEKILKREPLVCELLFEISVLFDDHSQIDYQYGMSNALSNNSKIISHANKNFPHNDLSMEITSWLELEACKQANCKLKQKLALSTENLPDSVYLNKSDFKIENFDGYNRNVVNAVNLIGNAILPIQHVHSYFEKVEYISMLKVINCSENLRHELSSSRTRRFSHYFDQNGLNVDEPSLNFLSKLLNKGIF